MRWSLAREQEVVLLVERRARLVHALTDRALHRFSVLLQLLELLDQPVGVHLMDLVAVLGQLHLAHQGRALVVKRNRDHGLVEQQGEENVVEAGCDDDVGRGELGKHVLNRRDRLLDDALLVIASEPGPEDGPEVLDHDRVGIAEQEPDVVVVLEQPCREHSERLQVGGVRLRTWIGGAVPSRNTPSTRDPRRASRLPIERGRAATALPASRRPESG